MARSIAPSIDCLVDLLLVAVAVAVAAAAAAAAVVTLKGAHWS